MTQVVRFGAYSGDPLLVELRLRERLAQLEAAVEPRFGDEITPEALSSELLTSDLFGGKRALVVRRAEPLAKSAKLAAALEAGLPEDVALFLIGKELRGSVIRRAEEQEHFPQPKRPQVRALARRLLTEAGLTPTPPMVEILAEACGTDTLRLAREVDKLSLWRERPLSPEEAAALLFAAQPVPYPLLDRIGARDVRGALGELAPRLTGPDAAFSLFFLVASHVRTLLAARAALDAGEQPAGPAWLARRRAEQARNFSLQELIELLAVLQELDLKIKNGEATPHGALTWFTLSLAV